MTEKNLLRVTKFYDKTLTNATDEMVYYTDNFVDNLHVVIYIIIGKTSQIEKFNDKISCFVGLMSAVVTLTFKILAEFFTSTLSPFCCASDTLVLDFW